MSTPDPDGKTVKTMEHRAGWDATFSAPKSVSLTALGEEEMAGAWTCTARASASVFEQPQAHTRWPVSEGTTSARRLRANSSLPNSSTIQCPVDGYVAPQLHTHAVIFNLTERENEVVVTRIQRKKPFCFAAVRDRHLSIGANLPGSVTPPTKSPLASSGAPEKSRVTPRNTSTRPVPRSQQIR